MITAAATGLTPRHKCRGRCISRWVIAALTLAIDPLGAVSPTQASVRFCRPSPFTSSEHATAVGLNAAVTALANLPKTSPTVALHISPEGHWQFALPTGDLYTAGTPDELKRAAHVIFPNAVDGFASATIVLSGDSLFSGAEVLKRLPDTKELLVAIPGGTTYPLKHLDDRTLAVFLSPILMLPVGDRAEFLETLFQLRRCMTAERVHILSMDPGGAAKPPDAKLKGGVGWAAIKAIDPAHLLDAIKTMPRDMIVLSAHDDGARYSFSQTSGPNQTVSRTALQVAAATADVDLVILETDPPRQPSGNAWPLQRIRIPPPLIWKEDSLGLFLDALTEAREPYHLSLSFETNDRVILVAEPATVTSSTNVVEWMRQAVAASATWLISNSRAYTRIEMHLTSSARLHELDQRWVAGVPSEVQGPLVGALVLGLGLTCVWINRRRPRLIRKRT